MVTLRASWGIHRPTRTNPKAKEMMTSMNPLDLDKVRGAFSGLFLRF